MTEREYKKIIAELCPPSPLWRDCFHAFWIGGLICLLGQVAINGYMALGLEKTNAATAECITLIGLSALLTGLSLYDNIAKHAGAGTLVPITGFANAVSAPAVEFKTDECDIIGLSRKAIQFMASMMI